MSAFNSISLACLVLLASFGCHGYRTRRSTLAGYGDPFALTDALQAVDRERRRTKSHLQDILDDDSTFFNPNTVSDIDEDYIRSLLYNLEEEDTPRFYPGFDFGDKYDAETPSFPNAYPELEDDLYEPIKRTPYRPHRVSPNLNQLQNIFGSTNIPSKRMAPTLNRPMLSENDIRKAEEDTRQLAHHMNKLAKESESISIKEISEQTDGNPPKMIKDTKVEQTGPDGKTKTLEQVFDGADTVTKTSETGPETDNNIEEKETEIQNSEGDDDAGLTKSKRASAEPCAQQSVYIGELLTEIARLRNKLSKLEVEQILEDEENDLLADALGYSTMNQQTGDLNYVKDEYNDIAKATKTEELIQMLAGENDEDDEEVYETAKERLEDFLEPHVSATDLGEGPDFEKRSDESNIHWYTKPVKESASGAIMVDEDPFEDVDDINDSFVVGGESPVDDAFPDEDDDEETDDDGDVDAIEAVEKAIEEQEAEDEEEEAEEEAEKEALETAVAEVASEIEEEQVEAQKVDMLKNVLQGLSSEELKDLIDELEQGQAIEAAANKVSLTCPVVEELSDNCAFADAVGLPIDTDARQLCVRHQLCNTCGAQIGISQSHCDGGYKGTVIAECDGDSVCMRSAAMFLNLMNRYHTYSVYGPEQCSSPCVEDFIVGGD